MSRWPNVSAGEIIRLDLHKETIDSSKSYDMVGVLSFGKGLFRRETITNGNTSYKYFLRLSSEHVIMSQLFGWEGALALCTQDHEGLYVSPQFPTFLCDESRLNRQFMGWVIKQPSFWNDLGSRAKGMGDRRRTLNPEALFASKVPLPPLSVQQTLVARLDALDDKVRQVDEHLDAIERDADHLLAVRFQEAIENAPMRKMAEVSPLVRRELTIDPEESYTELGVRSFYKGTFHRRTMAGSDYSWQDLYQIKCGDLIFSNIMAWEQAIAIAKPEDEDCVGNHRMLTCAAKPDNALPSFLWYYFTTPEGFTKIEAASPGTAARNKTLTAPALMGIDVPIPQLAVQKPFDALQAKIVELKAKHSAIREANQALIPAMLERIFGGEF